MKRREIVGLVLIVAAFALTPFAYGASVSFGIVAITVGLAGLLFFATARPWRSRVVDAEQYAEPRKVPMGLAMHDLEHAALIGSVHDSAHGGMPDGGGGHAGDGGGGGGDGGGLH